MMPMWPSRSHTATSQTLGPVAHWRTVGLADQGWERTPGGHQRARGAPVQRLPGTYLLSAEWRTLILRDCEPCWTAELARPRGLLSLRDLLAHISSLSETCTERRGKPSLSKSVNVPDGSFQQPLGQAKGSANSAQTCLSHMLTLG